MSYIIHIHESLYRKNLKKNKELKININLKYLLINQYKIKQMIFILNIRYIDLCFGIVIFILNVDIWIK